MKTRCCVLRSLWGAVVVALLLAWSPLLATAAPAQESHAPAPARPASPSLPGEAPVALHRSTLTRSSTEWSAVAWKGEAQGSPASAFVDQAAGVSHPRASTRTTAAWRSSPLMFIENVGQFAEGARFQVLGGERALWLAEDGLWVTVMEPPSLFGLPFEDDVEGWCKWEGTGDWAVVTGTLHGGEHSWGASQDGSALTLAGQLDLWEATTPRLSFWHLLEGDGAAGAVEVSPDGTTWLTLTTAGATEGTWQRVEADLSEYAGQMIHLHCRLDVPGGGNWWLDDLAAWEAIPPVVHSLPFDDDMEEPEANWRAVNGWQPVTTTAHSGTSAWWGSEDDSALILVDQLDLTDAVSPTLTFWQRFALPEGSVGQVRVTADDELTWRPVLTVTEPVSDWTQVGLDLSGYAGRRVGLAFVLEETASGEGTGSAWPGPAVRSMATVLPLAAVALAGVAGVTVKRRYRQLGRCIVVVGAVLMMAWVCCNLSGLWRYVPPLRTWKINHLDVVEGCEVGLIVSASRNPSGAHLSPNGRWLLTAHRFISD
ncbi:MAG: hypothetical protein ACE5OS_09510, partial [Anaerolineae bacterium]